MKKIISIISISFILINCEKSKNNIRIINECKNTIDSIILIGNQKCNPLIIKNILPNNSKIKKLENCNESGGDGSYIVKIYTKNSEIIKGYGYFSNGKMYFDEVEIKFTKKNGVIITE